MYVRTYVTHCCVRMYCRRLGGVNSRCMSYASCMTSCDASQRRSVSMCSSCALCIIVVLCRICCIRTYVRYRSIAVYIKLKSFRPARRADGPSAAKRPSVARRATKWPKVAHKTAKRPSVAHWAAKRPMVDRRATMWPKVAR